MAHQNPLARWALTKKDELGLKVTELTWAQKRGIALFDFEVSIRLNGKILIGRGTDKSQSHALEKAVAESLERAICSLSGISTEGVAVHLTSEKARAAAELESIERFCFNRHKKLNLPLVELSVDPSVVSTINNFQLSERGSIRVNFYKLSGPSELITLLCKINYEDQIFIGLACAHEMSAAYEKSLAEAQRNLAAFIGSPAAFKKLVVENEDLWCADAAKLQWLESLCSGEKFSLDSFPKYQQKISNIDFSDSEVLRDAPILAVRAMVDGDFN